MDEIDDFIASLPTRQRAELDRQAARLAWIQGAASEELAAYDLDAPLCSGHHHDPSENPS